MKALVLLLLASAVAHGGYEEDLRKVNALGNRADSMLSKFGFNFGAPSAQDSKTNSDEKRRTLFRVHGSLSTSSVPAGTLAYGSLLNRLVVGTEDSPVLITVEFAKVGWIRGLRLMGKARQSSTPGRVNLEFDRVLLKNGKTVALQAIGMDEDGALGLTADVFSGKALMVAGSMVGSFLSGYASGQQTNNTNAFGFSQTQPTGRNSLLQGVAQTAADQSKRLIDEATEEKPVLVVNPGTEVSILFKEEVSL